MSKYYYVDSMNRQMGPVDETELRQCGVTSNTMVWTQGMRGWQPAGSIFPVHMLADGYGECPPYAQPPCQERQPYPPRPRGPQPSNYLVWSILTTLFCCLPAGIVAIVYSAKVDSAWAAGRYDDAVRFSKNAKQWCIISALISVVSSIVFTILYFTALGASLSAFGAF